MHVPRSAKLPVTSLVHCWVHRGQVHCERWVAPYNGGAELAGCGGGLPAFATKPQLDAAELGSALHGKRQSMQALHLVAGGAGLTEGTLPAAWERCALRCSDLSNCWLGKLYFSF